MAKKVLSIALALLMIVNVFAVAVSATEWTTEKSVITLTTDNAKPQPGDEVTVTVSLKNNYNVHALQLMLAYDKNYYDVVGTTAEGVFTNLLNSDGAVFTPVVQSFLGSAEQEAMYGGLYSSAQKAQFGLLRMGYVWLASEGSLDGNTPTATFTDTTALASFKLKVKATAPTDGKGVIMVDPTFVVPTGTDVPSFDTRVATYVGKGAATIAQSAATGKLYGLPLDVAGAKFAGCTHANATAVAAKAATHTEDGNTAYWYCADCKVYFADAAFKTETTLAATVIPATGHDSTAGIVWSFDGENHWKACSCGEKLEVAAHEFSWVIDTDSTCDAEGVKHEECACGAKRSEGTVIEKKEHEISKVDAKAPTCTENGNIAYWACPNCAKYYADEACTEVIALEDTVIGATGHNEVADEAVAPTCTETGLTAGSHCSVCDEVIVAQEEIPATGHTWGEWTIVKDAGIGVEGLKERTCLNGCGEKEEEKIPALDEPEADYDALNALVTEANELNRDLYKPAGLAVVDAVIAKIDYTLKESQQATVDGWATELRAAIDALEEKPSAPADYDALNEVIATIPDGPNRTNGVYVAEELAAIDEMVAGFDMFLADTDQAIVDGYVTALTEAIAALTRDLSKAEAKVTTVLSQKAVAAGDVIDVTVKLTSNYPITNIQLPILYDKTEFQIVGTIKGGKYLSWSDDSSFAADSYEKMGNAGIVKGFQFTSNPDKWNTDEAKAQYDYALISASFNSMKADETNSTFAVPNDEVLVTYQLKALQDVEDTTASVFISPEWTKTATVTAGTFAIGFAPTSDYVDVTTHVTTGMTYKAETIAIEGVTVSGTVESGDDKIAGNDTITIELFAEGSDVAAYTATVEGSEKLTAYAIETVAPGTYTVKVSKANHVTREYTITVEGEDLTQDMKIHLVGDVDGNGKITTVDVVRINSHVRKTTLLTGYEFDCGDVSQDGKIVTVDVVRINAHLRNSGSLWK